MVLMLSIVSFAGSTIFGMARTYSEALTQPVQTQAETTETASLQAEQQAEIQGYESVLKREPDNGVALEGLVNMRLQMKDYKGAIAPLEKLVKLNPERSDYAQLLAKLKKK